MTIPTAESVPTGAAASQPTASEPTASQQAPADADIAAMRARLDQIDAEIIRLWQERAGISRQVGAIRMAAGGTRLALAREQEILSRFREALGSDGTQLAMLILRAGRGPLL